MNKHADGLVYQPIFTEREKVQLHAVTRAYSLHHLISHPRHFEDVAITYAYVASHLVGNAYTLMEAVGLIKWDTTANRKHINDALRLRNLHQVFVTLCLGEINGEATLSRATLCGLHDAVNDRLYTDAACCLSKGLVGGRRSGDFVEHDASLDNECEAIFKAARDIDDPFERAVFVHLSLANLVYFSDGNLLTARLMEAGVLAQVGMVPVLLRVEDEADYLKCVRAYAETGDAKSYAGLFLKRYQWTIDRLLGRTVEQQEAQALAERAIWAKRGRGG